ncbi:MAG TPA: hypothetical protein VF081_06095 [Solirubrobacterales bacterium]
MEAPFLSVFNDHPAHAHLKEARRQIAEFPEEVREAARENDPDGALDRLPPALGYVGALLGSANPALVTPQMLDDLDAQLVQLIAALGPLRESNDFAQIPTIQSGTESLLNAAARVAPAVGVWAKETEAQKAATHLGEAATAKTEQLQKQASDLKGDFDRLKEEAAQTSASVKATSDERVNELQGQLDTLKADAEAERKQAQDNIQGFQDQFKSDQDKRVEEFEAAKLGLDEQATQAIQEAKDAATQALESDHQRSAEAISKFEDRAEEILAFLGEKRDEATNLVDTAATSSIAGGFKKEAEKQQEQADRWRRYAVLIATVAALVGVAGIIASFFYEANTSAIVAKVAAVTLLLGIAGYAAGQSAQHRRREQRAMRLYLELVAFKPFAEPLEDPADRATVRKDFIERMFVGDPGDDHPERDPRLSDENLSALAKLVDLIRSVPGSRPNNS